MFPAEMINHDRMLVKEVKAEISLEYGKYLSTSCQGCHRENMKGGEPVAPGFLVVADISSTGNPGKWSDELFIRHASNWKNSGRKNSESKRNAVDYDERI